MNNKTAIEILDYAEWRSFKLGEYARESILNCMEQYANQFREGIKNTYQLCPKCYGQGKVWFPPNQPYSPVFSGNGQMYECDVCNGKKIISTL